MHALKKFSMVITFAAFSLAGSSAWATGGNSFVAEAKSDDVNGFNVVPPVLTSRTTDDVCLEFTSQPSTTATGEELPSPARNPWRIRVRQPGIQGDLPVSNIRLYFGQHFANGRPIATLCDQAISTLKCEDKSTDISPNPGISLTDIGADIGAGFQLSDIQFQGQQVDFCCGSATIEGTFLRDVEKDRVVLPNDKDGLAIIKALIGRGLIYIVINSAFEATLNGGEIIGYTPTTGVIDGDGEIRGTLSLARETPETPKRLQCPPPSEPPPNE